MRGSTQILATIVALSTLALVGPLQAAETQDYIVVVNGDRALRSLEGLEDPDPVALGSLSLLTSSAVLPFNPTKRLELIDGYVVSLDIDQARELNASLHSEVASWLEGMGPLSFGPATVSGSIIMEPNRLYHLLESDEDGQDSVGRPFIDEFTPASMSTAEQIPWGVEAVQASKVWDKDGDGKLDEGAPTGKGVKVGILDTGIDYTHPDLAPRYKDGIDIINGDRDPMDDQGHGTHVAGTIAAAMNGGGVVGVAPEAELYAIKVMGAEGQGDLISIIQGLEWAAREGLQVVNMSLGSPMHSMAFDLAVYKADQAGVLVVAASGNEGSPMLSYPAAYDAAIAVGAVDREGVLAHFSQFGYGQELVAPGVEIASSVLVGQGLDLAIVVKDKSFSFKHPVMMVENAGFTGPKPTKGTVVYAALGLEEDFQGLDVKGKIVLMDKGEIYVRDKILHAKEAGAAAALVANDKPGPFVATMGLTAYPHAVGLTLSQEDGQALREAVEAKPDFTISLQIARSNFARHSGTSMACPHVTGVAALLRGARPEMTNNQLRERLKETAKDLGKTGYDVQYGFGLVNAAKALAP